MTTNDNKFLISIARTIQKKGLAFCLYRFPNEKIWHIAVDKQFLSTCGHTNSREEATQFMIAPFIEGPEASTATLQKLPGNMINDRFLALLTSLPDKEMSWGTLPVGITKKTYLEKCCAYLADIKNTSLSKAILSRVIIREKSSFFDEFSFFAVLADCYPETFVSLFYLPGAGMWTGASPELLLEKHGREYKTMALAATRPRRKDRIYHWRPKEKEEHHMVREHIEQIFSENGCTLLRSEGPFTVETGKVAHLRTDYLYEEGPKNRLRQIVSALHPTPAVGGLPVKPALECIKKHEGYNRNYYTGYLGETNGNDMARLFINLRCMQIGENSLAVFAGGGISADSEQEEEWLETRQKSLTLIEKIEETIRTHTQKNEVI